MKEHSDFRGSASSHDCIVRGMPVGIAKVMHHWLRNWLEFSFSSFARLEPCAGKLARTVLRGGVVSNGCSLPDFAEVAAICASIYRMNAAMTSGSSAVQPRSLGCRLTMQPSSDVLACFDLENDTNPAPIRNRVMHLIKMLLRIEK